MEGYYAYWETVGFKLAHPWGFQWADHFLPICHFRLHTGHSVYRKIQQPWYAKILASGYKS